MSASSKKKLRKEQAAAKLTEKQQKEKAAAKKLKITTIVFCAVMAAVLVIALTTFIVGSINRSGVVQKNTVAAKIGEHTLNTVEMNYYYIDTLNSTYNNWTSQFGDYMDFYMQAMGLDLTQPLGSQIKDATTQQTWADYFVDEALRNAQNNFALADKAAEEGFSLPEEDAKNIESNLQSLLLTARFSGYASLDDYLEALYGFGADEASYRAYVERSYLATAYYEAHQESLTYDAEDLQAYDEENPGAFDTYTYSSYTVNYSDFLVGGTKEVARGVAEKLAKELANCTTLEELNAAIAELPFTNEKEKTPTASTFTDSYSYDVNTTYRDWMIDPEREEGDISYFLNDSSITNEDGTTTTVVNGYYVVLLEKINDNKQPLANVRHLLVQPKGGTTTSTGSVIYSDKEMYDAKCRAEVLLAEWEAGERTEESFIALLKEKSADTASVANDGLIENIAPDDTYVKNFQAWAVDPARQIGDVGIVETEYGYHIMYFSSFADTCYRDIMITETKRAEDMESWYRALVEALPIEKGNISQLNMNVVLVK